MSGLKKNSVSPMCGKNIHTGTKDSERAIGDCRAALTAFAPLAMTVGTGPSAKGVGA